MGFFGIFGGNKKATFKPVNVKLRNPKLLQYAQGTLETLGSGDMSSVVKLPAGEDLNEWLAVNTVDFFNEINLIFAVVQESCTPASCPKMAAASHEYLWQDTRVKGEPVSLCAHDYVEKLMDWTESQLNDEQVFPLQHGQPFPKDFRKKVSAIFRRFFRVYAHIYCAHMDAITKYSAEAHLNTCFKHFYYFIQEFQLVDPREYKPLEGIISRFK